MSAFRIEKVIINSEETWQDISNLNTWQILKSSNQSWEHINQITKVNQPVVIEVVVIVSSWERISGSFNNWQSIKDTNNTWLTLQTW